MYSKTPPNMINKRPREDSSIERPRKRASGSVKAEDNASGGPQIFKFRILLPNGTTVELKLSEQRAEIPIEEFLHIVKKEYSAIVKQRRLEEPKRRIDWNYRDLHFTDAHTNTIRTELKFRDFVANKWHFLWLDDGSAEPEAYQDMWDLTPDTDLLKELPDDYTFETALADLIDNSLQALWSNRVGQRKLISVELLPGKITIFDSGPGMDGADGNLVKWGKMGASLHRSVRGQAIGGKPPYLMPFFGMFGYGGPVAAMCLGRHTVVSSKTKNCDKVFMLHLEREALMSASCPENSWKTKGGKRDPFESEKKKSPHGSFTKVEIFEPKKKALDIVQFQCKLKDIYFPYIQCDEMSGKTSRPIEFKVNGKDLAGVQGGEVATTNLHSCNGPDFILQLHFSTSQDTNSTTSSQSQKVFLEANARLKCVYFPVIQGEESIQRIIDKLNSDGYGIRESYESFSRVSVRQLGRLLPETRWTWLPFMEPKQKKGERAQILKRCCSRVKCFIETDSGFNPTPHKTDLAHQHPYTKALKNFGNSTPENENEVQIEISRDGKILTLLQLEKQYNDWVLEMHERYDEEVDGGLDQPTIVVVTSKIKRLGMTSEVLRVHEKITRKGKNWIAGQKIKLLKGACAGCHKNNIFATLEYIILDGLPGDACGEARLIVRPLGVPEEKGCHLFVQNGNKTVDLRGSLSCPISVIDSETCIAIDDIEWENKLEQHHQKLPAAIDLLSDTECQELQIEGGLPTDVVEAGDVPPENFVAVIRPKAFNSRNISKRLDQRFIVRDTLEMSLEVEFKSGDNSAVKSVPHYSVRKSAASRNGIHGLYIFPVKDMKGVLFQKVGVYTFSFSLNEFKDVRFERLVKVQASAEVGSWKIINDKQDARCTVRVGSRFEPLSLACYDKYNNRIPLTTAPKVIIKLSSDRKVLAQVHSMKVEVRTDKSSMTIKDVIVESGELDKIRPSYEATLNISTLDEAFSVAFPCRVIPGTPEKIILNPTKLRKQLIPGQIIEELRLEVFDAYGNHVKENENVSLRLDGFSFQDGFGIDPGLLGNYIKKVNADGFVDLSNMLKVSKGYGKDVSFCVLYKERVIFRLQRQTEMRELRTQIKVFKSCEIGSELENVVFEVTNMEGEIDESIHDEEEHGKSHTLTIKSKSFDVDDTVRYSFRNGRCVVRSIPLPHTEGFFSFSAAHSRYPELSSDLEVHVEKVWQGNHISVGDYEDIENPVLAPQNSCDNFLVPCSRSPAVTEVAYDNFTPRSSRGTLTTNSLPGCDPHPVISPQSSCKNALTPYSHCLKVDGHAMLTPESSNRSLRPKLLTLDYSPPLKSPQSDPCSGQDPNLDMLPLKVSASRDLGNSVGSALPSKSEVEDDLVNFGLQMLDHQRELERLENYRSHIQQHISDLQASMDRASGNKVSMYSKEMIIKKIESKSQRAAAVICKLHEQVPFQEKRGDIIGVVALLGIVETIELSRMLAQYIGEDQMLAIVCKDYEAAYHLETDTIPKLASKYGQSISGGYLALCIEDIRPIMRKSISDPQEPLPLQNPTLSNGGVPRGFRGYAVNMISIVPSHLNWRTKDGHDLRRTLFYRLFGDLQVYKDRDSMLMARSCIKGGAISLDGGFMKDGLISLGHWEPDVLFPVKTGNSGPQSLRISEMIAAKQVELVEINHKIDEQTRLYEIVAEKVRMARDRYNKHDYV